MEPINPPFVYGPIAMFFSFPHAGGIFKKGSTEAAVNVANIAFVEFGAVKDTPYANVYLQGHDCVFTIAGQEVVGRLRQAIGLDTPAMPGTG